MNALSPQAQALVSTSLSTVSPDAELIHLCAQAEAVHKEYDALTAKHAFNEPPEARTRTKALVDEGHRLSEEIADVRAHTAEGMRAKARVMLHYTCKQSDGSLLWSDHDQLLGWSLANDVLGDGAGPDAHLLDLGVQLDAAIAAEREAWDAVSEDIDDDHPFAVEADRLNDATGAIAARIATCPATTGPGLAVKLLAFGWCQHGTKLTAQIARAKSTCTSTADTILHSALLDALAMSEAPRPSPDAALLAKCEEFHRLHVVFYSLPDDGPDEAMNKANECVYRLAAAIARMRPTTHAGRVAMAGVALILAEADTECGRHLEDATEKVTLMALRAVASQEPSVQRGLVPIRRVLRNAAKRVKRELAPPDALQPGPQPLVTDADVFVAEGYDVEVATLLAECGGLLNAMSESAEA